MSITQYFSCPFLGSFIVASLMWSTPGQFLETDQMRINIRAGNLQEMGKVRDILESRYGAREVRAVTITTTSTKIWVTERTVEPCGRYR